MPPAAHQRIPTHWSAETVSRDASTWSSGSSCRTMLVLPTSVPQKTTRWRGTCPALSPTTLRGKRTRNKHSLTIPRVPQRRWSPLPSPRGLQAPPHVRLCSVVPHFSHQIQVRRGAQPSHDLRPRRHQRRPPAELGWGALGQHGPGQGQRDARQKPALAIHLGQ